MYSYFFDSYALCHKRTLLIKFHCFKSDKFVKCIFLLKLMHLRYDVNKRTFMIYFRKPLLPSASVSDVENTSVQADDTTDEKVDEEQREQGNGTTHPDHTIINVNHCAGYNKLTSVSPSDNDTRVKVAIQGNEHEMTN